MFNKILVIVIVIAIVNYNVNSALVSTVLIYNFDNITLFSYVHILFFCLYEALRALLPNLSPTSEKNFAYSSYASC